MDSSTHGGAAPSGGDAEGAPRAELLLVDNDERIVELLSWFLRERGFGVRTAESFAVARERLRERLPDLLVSDVDLGTESAVVELPRLHAEGLLPPTLVVSGYLDMKVKAALLAVPRVLDTLAKPFEFMDLEAKIDACLAREAAPEPLADVTVVPAAAPAVDTVVDTVVATGEPAADDDGWIEITPRS